MIKKIKNFLNPIFIIFFLLTSFQFCNAGNLQDAFGEDYVGETAFSAGYETDSTAADYVTVISSVIQTVLSLLGVIFLILLIYGGFLWMTARGNEQQVEKAKEVMYSSIVGLIIILAAYSISYFVVFRLTNGVLAT